MLRFELSYRQAALADLEDIFRVVLRVSTSPVVARRYVKLAQPAQLAELGPDPYVGLGLLGGLRAQCV